MKRAKASKSKAGKPHLKQKARSRTSPNTKPSKSKTKSKSAARARSTRRNPAPKSRPQRKPPSSRGAAAKKAAATKRRNRAAEAESARLSQLAPSRKKSAKVRQRRRRAREKRGQLEAKIVAAGPRAEAVYSTLVSAFERMSASSGLELEIRGAPNEGKTPWLVQGAFISDGTLTYDRLMDIFAEWEHDYILEATIKPRRIAWIRWEVQFLLALSQRDKRDGGGFAPGGIGEWNRVISEAQQSAEEMSERYDANPRNGDGMITEVLVYLGATVLTERTVRL